jgi:hypothetical protein
MRTRYVYSTQHPISQVRYNIIFPNAMITNASRQQPATALLSYLVCCARATAFGTCVAVLVPLAHPGSSTYCHCNACINTGTR